MDRADHRTPRVRCGSAAGGARGHRVGWAGAPQNGCMGSPETVELAGALSEMAARVASARVAAAHRDGTSVVGTGVTVDGEHGSWEEPIAELVWIRECRAALRLIELESAADYLRVFSDVAWKARVAALSEGDLARLKEEITQAVQPFLDKTSGRLRLTAMSLCASGRK